MHFVVLVIGDNPTMLLDPYDVNNPSTDYFDKEEIINLSRYYYFNYNMTASDNDVWKEYLDHWDNPNSNEEGLYPFYNQENIGFWDWYTIGGRWNGLIKLKLGRNSCDDYSHLDLENDEETISLIAMNRCNSAYIKDIDNLSELATRSYSLLTENCYYNEGELTIEDKLAILENNTEEILTIIDCHI